MGSGQVDGQSRRGEAEVSWARPGAWKQLSTHEKKGWQISSEEGREDSVEAN